MVGEDDMLLTLEQTRDVNGKLVTAERGIVGGATNFTSDLEHDKVLDAAAIGTTILSISVPAYTTFACSVLSFSCNASVLVIAGSGTLGSTTDYFSILIPTTGLFAIADGESPFFVYTNTTGSAVTLLFYAPQKINNAAGNNANTKYVQAYAGGKLIRNAQ